MSILLHPLLWCVLSSVFAITYGYACNCKFSEKKKKCELVNDDTSPGCPCACGENNFTECHFSKVTFFNGRCGACPGGSYFNYDENDCQVCARPNTNCKENVRRDCRPCENKNTDSTTSTASPAIQSTSTTPPFMSTTTTTVSTKSKFYQTPTTGQGGVKSAKPTEKKIALHTTTVEPVSVNTTTFAQNHTKNCDYFPSVALGFIMFIIGLITGVYIHKYKRSITNMCWRLVEHFGYTRGRQTHR